MSLKSKFPTTCLSAPLTFWREVDDTVANLKKLGYTKANRSSVLRIAFREISFQKLAETFDKSTI